MSTSNNREMLLGSGKLYVAEFTGTLPELSTLISDTNKIADIQSGAVLTYKPTYYDAKSDLGILTKSIITEEEVTLKTGLMQITGESFKQLCDTARVTSDGSTNVVTTKIGGIGNNSNKKWVIVFHYADEYGTVDVCIVGKNQSGFVLSFIKDKETVVDAEFKALAQDSEGTLIKYVETPKASE